MCVVGVYVLLLVACFGYLRLRSGLICCLLMCFGCRHAVYMYVLVCVSLYPLYGHLLKLNVFCECVRVCVRVLLAFPSSSGVCWFWLVCVCVCGVLLVFELAAHCFLPHLV